MVKDDDRRGLRETLERYRAYYESSSSGIFVYDETGRLVDINQAACDMHGFSREEMLAMDPREFIAPESHWVFEAFLSALEAGRTFRGEARGLRRDGSRFDVAVEGRRIESGGRTYAFSSLIDITEKNRAESHLRHAQRLEAVGQLAGGVAHDFNNLLSVIFSSADLLELSARDDDQRKQVAQIQHAATRARDLVQQLLVLSRREDLEIEHTDMARWIRQQHATLRRLLPAEIAVELTVEGDDLVAAIDRGQMEQAVLNLAINAKQAMPDGGRIELSLWRSGQHLHLRVRDSGQGMDAETQARIFEPFFTTKPRGQGTGLGLPMVSATVQRHDGLISVSSAPGEGAVFEIQLPAAPSSLGDRPTRD